MYTTGIRSHMSIDTLDRHLDRYGVDQYLDNTRLTVAQQLVDSQLSVDQLICIH